MKVTGLFVPDFEMVVSPEMAKVVKPYGGLLQVDLKYSTHDIEQECSGNVFVVSQDSEGFFEALVDDVKYSCGNYLSGDCPDMLVEYVDETTVTVSGIFALRSHYPLSHIQQCARNIISLGRSLERYVDVGGYNQRTYDVL
ncbi:hypothetical protein [Pseudoalteromonas marina]|uniref:Uncharacterized protein n=1 Tax=Pseudoalteromonas marina TaxID=267375 RepID=A0ABT9FCC1_9GAMM|nr:hypothetical protein [Pseudoalteromonas marina]MDP2564430.1 hypothetical protein [Pseudoalteromonas marina]